MSSIYSTALPESGDFVPAVPRFGQLRTLGNSQLWQDVVNYTGQGYLSSVAFDVADRQLEVRVTIDGNQGAVVAQRQAEGVISGLLRFRQSLRVEARRTTNSNSELIVDAVYLTDI